ncbi:hypothetical protein [Haloimpatiens lingqiaonensis]|uniref:hypothetical protein n=1 Tax=Haloimpatiens lingqiaonensis TaxID=1380675 RepID=UPI0037BEB292
MFSMFPQWNETTKENLLITDNYYGDIRDYRIFENIYYPKFIKRLQILYSKYIVTEKYRIRNRYNENTLNSNKEFEKFLEGYINNDNISYSGKHCTMCPYLNMCLEGEYVIDRYRR